MAGVRRDREQYGGGSVQGARMWLEVGETEDSMAEAVCNEPGCGWRQRPVWWRQCARGQDVAGDRRDRGQYDGGSV